jgi:hypothetical protein
MLLSLAEASLFVNVWHTTTFLNPGIEVHTSRTKSNEQKFPMPHFLIYFLFVSSRPSPFLGQSRRVRHREKGARRELFRGSRSFSYRGSFTGGKIVTGMLSASALLAVLPFLFTIPTFGSDYTPPFSIKDAPWKTNFAKHSVPLREILSGGPPRDGIPPLDRPQFESAESAGKWIKAQEPVILLEWKGEAKAYPLQVLIWHEIVNDSIGGDPVAVTFCPLCNSAITFWRKVDGKILDFGTTGRLRHSDLIMYDRQTETWWQQFTGEAIIGEKTGKKLDWLHSRITSYKDFRLSFPQGKVLSRETGFSRPYGKNPYAGYDEINKPPFLLDSKPDDRLPPMERVVAISIAGIDRAYPYSLLSKKRVVNDRIEDTQIVVFYTDGTLSVLDADLIAESRAVGATAVFNRVLNGGILEFVFDRGLFKDKGTGSRWNLGGKAVSGPLKGKNLKAIPHFDPFAFSWLAFKPKTGIYQTP